ncbi:MAG: methylated-DNA--[protein]-cysteine S-methyltransferase [Firmicutes bacterium]|nr:methylated-DNA--[protein]-cysteine S-methyltransferase [Bacillota bacterium]
MNYLTMDSPIGNLTIVAVDDFITNLYFDGEYPLNIPQSPACGTLKRAQTQLGEYFAGTRKVFELPLKPKGGEFFQRVWQIMQDNVPYGTTASYQSIAALAGNPRASRAVGMANNRNPIAIIIPCHRIVGKNGNLTGFRGGLSIKEKLLILEK